MHLHPLQLLVAQNIPVPIDISFFPKVPISAFSSLSPQLLVLTKTLPTVPFARGYCSGPFPGPEITPEKLVHVDMSKSQCGRLFFCRAFYFLVIVCKPHFSLNSGKLQSCRQGLAWLNIILFFYFQLAALNISMVSCFSVYFSSCLI